MRFQKLLSSQKSGGNPRSRWDARALRLLAIAAISVTAGILTSGPNPVWLPQVGQFEQAAQGMRLDTCAKLHPEWSAFARAHVVLVPIEDSTLSDPGLKLNGKLPVPRDFDAHVLDQLAEAGTRVVVFDMSFQDKSPAEDAVLRAAIQRATAAGCNVVSAVYWENAGELGVPRLILPAAELLDGSGLRVGHSRAPQSADPSGTTSVIDRIEPALSQPRPTVALALEAARCYFARGGPEAAVVRVPDGWNCGSVHIPEDPANPGTMAIHYFAPPASDNFNFFVSLPFEYVYEGGAARGLPGHPDFFKGKIVIVGDMTPLSHDFYNTPLGPMSGMEIHGHTIATILTGAWVRNVPPWLAALTSCLLVPVTMALGFRLRSGFALIWALVVFGLYLVLDIALFCQSLWILPLAGPLLAGSLGLLGSTFERSWWQDRDRAELRTVAAQYVSEQVASEGAPRGRVTMVFTDIQDSSRLSLYLGKNFEKERGESFRLQREAAREHHGFEVETAGDSLYLVFSSPADAVRFAIEAQKKLMSHPWPATIGRLRVRMGIHTGTPIIDRDRQRLTYRGFDTNVAARVAAAADGGEILITEETRGLAEEIFLRKVHFLSRGPVELKGIGARELFQVIPVEDAM